MVEGNNIGLDSSETTAVANNGDGVFVDSSGNTIGGTVAGAGNVIARNTGAGVFVNSGTGDSILSNSIFGNGGLGIDLAPKGVNPNTPGGPHSGPNNLQNFPVLTSLAVGPNNTIVIGTFNGAPNANFTLQFFGDAGDPSGHGQGQTYLGQTTVVTDGAGNANFTANFIRQLPNGETNVSATATDAGGDTSEFSADIQSLSFVVTNTNDSGPGSLRQAILNVNLATINPGITFDIPGQGPFVINPRTPLPSIANPTTIDATTQPGFAGTPIVEIDGKNAGAARLDYSRRRRM